jgi:hypothetical protein
VRATSVDKREDAEFDDEMPTRPKLWGKQTFATFMPDLSRRFDNPPDPGRIERVGGSLIITWDRFDLSGLARRPLAPLALFVPGDHAGRTLPIEWSASSRRTRGVLTGQMHVPVSATTLAPGAVLDARDAD